MISKLTTGEAIVESLIQSGVDTVFGIPGAHTYHLYDALFKHQDEIKHVVTRHEQAAGYMAFGYAKSTGKTGVYTVVPGPGVLNSGAALCTGYGANTPMFCITAEIPSAMIGQGRGILHELKDQLAVLKLLTKWSGRINHPTEVPRQMEEAIRHLTTGRIQPVAIEVPWDVMAMKANVDTNIKTSFESIIEPAPDQIATASELVKAAQNPMIMVGSGAIYAQEEILEFAKFIQAPVVAHRSGRGIVGEDMPYGFNCAAAYKLWHETDLLIGVGSRLELQYLRWQKIPDQLKSIRIDIDPTELVRLRADVGILADAKSGMARLTDAVQAVIKKVPSREQEFIYIKEKSREEIQRVQPQMSYLDVIREVLPRDGFFVEEISQVGFTARFGMPVYEPRTYVSCGYQDNLGFGYNTALGVKVANPDKVVISVSGDGGFLYGVQELATAAKYNIGVVAIVFNNSAFGNVLRDQQQKFSERVIAAELTNPDFVTLAESFGVAAYRANDPEQLRTALQTAVDDGGPALIEVPCERGMETSPWDFLMPGTY